MKLVPRRNRGYLFGDSFFDDLFEDEFFKPVKLIFKNKVTITL